MASRDSLHRLIDDLPETEITRAERLLEVLKETADLHSHALENAPEDDEPETPEEAAAVAEAWREHKEGRSLTTPPEYRLRVGGWRVRFG
jgi:hypothetical protein